MKSQDPVYGDNILAFDPGKITGISFVCRGSIVWGMVASLESFSDDNFFLCLTRMTLPSIIVVEKPPDGGFPNQAQKYIYNYIVNWYETAGFAVRLITPSQWKKMISRSDLDPTHMRDAADMARWVYRKIGGNSIYEQR